MQTGNFFLMWPNPSPFFCKCFVKKSFAMIRTFKVNHVYSAISLMLQNPSPFFCGFAGDEILCPKNTFRGQQIWCIYWNFFNVTKPLPFFLWICGWRNPLSQKYLLIRKYDTSFSFSALGWQIFLLLLNSLKCFKPFPALQITFLANLSESQILEWSERILMETHCHNIGS